MCICLSADADNLHIYECPCSRSDKFVVTNSLYLKKRNYYQNKKIQEVIQRHIILHLALAPIYLEQLSFFFFFESYD